MEVVPPPDRLAVNVELVIRRRSAVPAGAPLPGVQGEMTQVVMSTTRKRRRVTAAPVLFLTLRRIESVPLVEVAPGPGVKSRARAQAEVVEPLTAQPGSTSDSLIVALRSTGLDKFSGPGAPSRCGGPTAAVDCVSTNMKSVAL